MNVYSFDRDECVDVNPMNISHPSIPLEWVQYLQHHTDHEVWVHGNQKLRYEAGIPGKSEAVQEYEESWGDPIGVVNERENKSLEERVAGHPDPDITTAAANIKRTGKGMTKQQQLRLLRELYPDADRYICTDNRYLGYVSGWDFYLPYEFVNEFDWIQNEIENLSEEIAYKSPTDRPSVQMIKKIGRYLPSWFKNFVDLQGDKRIPIRFK